MTLLQRKNAKNATKTNDFKSLTWEKLALTVEKAETLVGKNAQMRYGIATETDVGLSADKYVLVPIIEGWKTDAELANMYTHNVLMCGIHPVLGLDDKYVTAPFPPNKALEDLHKVEVEHRLNVKAPALEGHSQFKFGDAGGDELSTRLTFICTHMNFLQFRASYTDLAEGVIIAGAHAIAMSFREGLLENYASREFVFVSVKLLDNGGYTVRQVDPSYAKNKNAAIHENDTFGPDVLRMNQQLMELGLAMGIAAGTTHYMMNHTTGGQRLNGHNLKALTLNNLYTIEPGMDDPTEERQTEFIYNVTHPVNKRAVANLVLMNSRVYSWHRSLYMPNPSILYADTFMTYRQNLVPSGAHKVYVAAFVLRQIASDSLAIFLPDVELAKKVVRLYGDIQRLGARAHVGSRYYTDEPVAISQGEVDDFLPLAAYYVQNKMTTSSIASSPHLTPEMADSATAKWKSIIDATIKSGAYNAPIDQIKRYLEQAGETGFRVDISTETGITEAIAVNSQIESQLDDLF